MTAAPPTATVCPGCAGGTAWLATDTPRTIRAVTVDLDDTLFPQQDWLCGAWRAVAAAGGQLTGCDESALLTALEHHSAQGSAQGGIIDRALSDIGTDPGRAPELVAVFRRYRATELTLYPGVRAALDALAAAGVPVALITDGFPSGQQNKIDALRLHPLLTAVVFSDADLGRAYRKPRREPFLLASFRLGVPPTAIVHIGDRPEKDTAGAADAGFGAMIRVRTGEYSAIRCPRPATGCFPNAAQALGALTSQLLGGSPGRKRRPTRTRPTAQELP